MKEIEKIMNYAKLKHGTIIYSLAIIPKRFKMFPWQKINIATFFYIKNNV